MLTPFVRNQVSAAAFVTLPRVPLPTQSVIAIGHRLWGVDLSGVWEEDHSAREQRELSVDV